MNTGFRFAKGEIVGWLNSDDTFHPGAVKAAVEHPATHPDTAVGYGEAYYIDEKNAVTGTYPTEDFSPDRMAEACLICQPTAFIRRAALDGVGLLDPALNYCMDYDLWIRLGRRFRIDRIHRVLANSRRYPETKSFAFRDELFEEIYAVVDRSFGYISPHWRVCRVYYLLVDLFWPLARWLLWPARSMLPAGAHHWLRTKLPLLIDHASRRGANPWSRR